MGVGAGIDWQVVYAPPVLIVADAVSILLLRLWHIDRTATTLLVLARRPDPSCSAWPE